MNSINV